MDNNPVEQSLATVALALSFLVAVWVIFLGGPPLKRRYSDEIVDIARTLTIMVAALASAGVFVVIWRVQGRVLTAMGTLLPENPERMGLLLFVAFLVLLGTYVLTRVTKRTVRHWSKSGRISPHQREVAHHAIQIGLFVVALVFILGLFDYNPRDLFLGAGVIGVIVGFAARKTLSGVLSGFVILFGRPFEAGDWIAVGDREGIVTEITLFNTQIRTFNEEHVLVPNDSVTDREVTNYSKTDRLRIITEVGVDYDADIDVAATIAKEAIEGCDSVADTPGPDVILDSFADSSVVLQLRYWIDKPTIQRKLGAQNEVIDTVKKAFEEEDIKIPYPQRELMGREETDGLQLSSEPDVTVENEVQPAVRRVRADSTAVEEPVEDRYRTDDEMEGRPEAARDDDVEAEVEMEADDEEGDGSESGGDEGETDPETEPAHPEDGAAHDGDGDADGEPAEEEAPDEEVPSEGPPEEETGR
ncbi:mechanosensitive ion channel [Natronomonas salina]|uniref:mechanosensitive ion channel domain-containing protein n=1 Tax=Natronomonas salina TaxID=1710540 RepID=UPI0015B59746|nr:mechanosensitive ion channel domain-containing protein [Natronomonas salina]QLD87967.1 mechanosensitive ion channel [Natronomonas salina]